MQNNNFVIALFEITTVKKQNQHHNKNIFFNDNKKRINMKKPISTKKITIYSVSALIILIIFVIIITTNWSKDYEEDHEIDLTYEEPVVAEPTYIFGICADNYDIAENTINKNQVISDILSEYNVPQTTIYQLDKISKDTYSLRKLHQNNTYRLFLTKDSVPQAHYLVYDISTIDYVVYAFKDSIYSYLGALPTDTIINRISGTIDISLWDAMIDCGAKPVLAVDLADVYAWTIDFFGISKGDAFDVIYEEIYVEDELVGTGKILASNFITSGKNHLAFYYEDKDNKGYFDEDGNSLRRQFLKAPLSYSRISSGFSYARKHPITKKVRPHLGVDYAVPSGTPVYSVGDGVVIDKGWDKKGGGNYLKIRHNSTYTTLYMHLKGFAKGITKGSKVSQNQLIGYVGSTGASTGPHLDYRVFKNGSAINPLKMEAPPVEPIKATQLPAYKEYINENLELLRRQ